MLTQLIRTPRATDLKSETVPRVALIGPKGGGKTIYRLYLASGLDFIPEYVSNALRVKETGWDERKSEALSFDDQTHALSDVANNPALLRRFLRLRELRAALLEIIERDPGVLGEAGSVSAEPPGDPLTTLLGPLDAGEEAWAVDGEAIAARLLLKLRSHPRLAARLLRAQSFEPWGGETVRANGGTDGATALSLVDGWNWTSEPASEPRIIDGNHHLVRAQGTEHLTRHELRMPGLDDTPSLARAHVLDFPGEHWTQDVVGEYEGRTLEDLRLIASCRMVMLMLPFWLLIPREMREAPPAHGFILGRRRNLSEAEIRRDRDKREETLTLSWTSWLDRLSSILAPDAKDARGIAAGKKPNLLVVFTMLGSDWAAELRPEHREKGELAAQLKKIRGWMEQPLVQGCPSQSRIDSAKWFGLARPFVERAIGFRDVAPLRTIMDRLHGDLDRFVGITENLDTASRSTQRLTGRLRSICDGVGRHRARFAAINIVSERHFAIDEQSGEPMFRFEPSGANLPSIYLCASLDELR